MKKIISTVAALGLVAGVAGTASALDFSLSGQYVLEGYMMSNADGSGVTTDEDEGTDSAWVHTFQLKPTMTVNDKIKMIADIRMAKDSDWGSQEDTNRAKDVDTTSAANGSMADFDRTVDIHKLYMEYMSPVGKIRAGRTPAGAWAGDFLSTSTNANRLMWWPSFVQAPFSLVVFTQKSTDNDWYNDTSDGDNDLYEIGLGYKTDAMRVDVAYDYYNYKGNSDNGTPATNYDDQRHQIKGYAEMMLGPVALEGEFAHMFGTQMDYDIGTDTDVDAWAFMIDGSMKLDTMNVGLMYFYASGQDDTSANADNEMAMSTLNGDGLGDDFNPYYILTGDHTGMLNGDEYSANAVMKIAGVQCLGIHADMPVSDKLSLHGAVAYAWADTTAVAELVVPGIDDEYGWELDLGAKYKLLDNLTYEVRGAFFKTGDFFDDLNGAAAGVDDIYTLSHHLTMTF